MFLVYVLYSRGYAPNYQGTQIGLGISPMLGNAITAESVLTRRSLGAHIACLLAVHLFSGYISSCAIGDSVLTDYPYIMKAADTERKQV